LGAIFYELLTGSRPYPGTTVSEVLVQAQTADYVTPRKIKADVPKPLEAIALRALAAQPTDRYASAKDLADDVTPWLADEPVRADAEPRILRLRRWGGRHRALVSSGVVAFLFGVAALTGFALLAREHATALEGKNNELLAANVQLEQANTAERSAAQRALAS